MRDQVLMCLLLQFTGTYPGYEPRTPAAMTTATPACPLPCRCQEDGILLLVDCSELELTVVPSDLNPFTFYLDLSMNNISELQPNAFHNLNFLEELRLSGNHLRHISGLAFTGLHNLRVLMLQNNQLEHLSRDAPWDLPKLLSLRLDANLISELSVRTFLRLRSLKHLWLDDNMLTEVPVLALNRLPSLQAMTLAVNRIGHIPDAAFCNLSRLLVLNLHNNKIQTLGENSFEGLNSLEILDLNYNSLQEFPVAIRTLAKLQELRFHNNRIQAIPERAFLGNPLLRTINFYENPIKFVGRSSFQFLPLLHTLSLNGATDLREFPDLRGTTSLEILSLTRAGLVSLPQNLCQKLPNLRLLELSYNQIEVLPSFCKCQKLQEIDLRHNLIRGFGGSTFLQLHSLRTLDLSGNRIETITHNAFASLQSLVKLDLTDNLLSTLPLGGLRGLTHLKLKGNLALYEFLKVENFPKMRVIEMPYAYQCCVYEACRHSYNAGGQWEPRLPENRDLDLHSGPVALFSIRSDMNYEFGLEEFPLEEEESKMQAPIQCTPTPGPFKPCSNLFDSWAVRLGVWAISLVSLVCNSLLVFTVFASPSYLSPVKFVVSSISGANLLTGVCMVTLALVDTLTFGEFSQHGAGWESGAGCQAIGFLWVFASEASVFFLTLAAVQCSISVYCVRSCGGLLSFGCVRAACLCCAVLLSAVAALPLFRVGQFGSSALCLPSPLPEGPPSARGYALGLVVVNTLCLLAITGTYVKLFRDLLKGELNGAWDCAMVKHVTRLVFADCLLYCPVAFLALASHHGVVSVGEETMKSFQLVLMPLPAGLNPLLYLLFNPHFKEDLSLLWRTSQPVLKETGDSLVLEDSTRALVSLPDLDVFS